MTIRPDPTFHASPKLAMEAPAENFAYTLLLSPDFSKPDALAVIDVKPGSSTYSQVVHTVTMPNKGDEFHHFGWNACSSALSPLAGHAFLERRYLIIPGIRSSRIYIVDTKPDPTQAKIHKIIEPEEIFKKTGYSRPHTIHCGPEGIYVSTLGGGGKDGTDGPPGVFIMDCQTFEVLGRWEIDRGPQTKHYDFWWNLPRDYMVTQRVGVAAAVRERDRAGGSALEQIWPSDPLLGSAGAQECPDHRSRRQPSDGAGSSSRARSGSRVRLPGRRGRHHQPRRLDLDLVARGRKVPHREDRDDPARARAEGAVAAAAAGLWRGAAAGHRHRPVDGRQVSLRRPAGAPARCVNTMSAIPGSRNLPDRSTSAALYAARRIRTARPMRAVRRWSRSAATASASTGPTRSTRPGTISSIPMACRRRGDGRSQNRAVASNWQRTTG